MSIKEGMFASAKSSLADHYIQPFAIAIESSNSVVALIRSITGLLGPVSQLFGSKLIEKTSRKKILMRSFLAESLLILPLIIIGLLYYKEILTSTLPLILLLFFALYTIAMNLPFPAWFSWIGDLVDDKFRGRWFSKRTLLIGFVSIVMAISAAFLLDYFKGKELTMIGFGIIFFLAFLATRKIRIIPAKGQSFFEIVVSGMEEFMVEITGEEGRWFFPLIATVFIYIATCNLLGVSCKSGERIKITGPVNNMDSPPNEYRKTC